LKTKCFLTIFFLFTFSCSVSNRCGEIVSKVEEDDRYLFVLRFNDNTNFSNDFNGILESEVEVNLNIYQSFNVGDKYCVE